MTTLTKLNTFLVLIPLGLALAGCGPRSVAESFWRATREGDFEKARLLATNDSSEALEVIEKNRDSTDSRAFSVGDATVDGDKTICHTTYRDPQEEVPSDEIVTYLVREGGAWRVNAPRTVERMLAEALQGLGGVSDAVQGAVNEAVEQVGEAIAEAARTVMEDTGQSHGGEWPSFLKTPGRRPYHGEASCVLTLMRSS